MNLKFKNRSIVILFLMFMMVFGTVTAQLDEPGISRIGGDNRFETAARVAFEVYETANTVIIARGDDAGGFADGLSASVLAGALDIPILITRPDSLPSETVGAIKELGAERAYVLGSAQAISDAVLIELMDLGLFVKRLSGDNRYETAVKIANEANKGELAEHAFIVNGYCPADSLVAAPAAFKGKAVILQVSTNSIPGVTRDALDELDIKKVYIIGSEVVVSQTVENELKGMLGGDNVIRLAGPNRYATSVAVAEAMFPGEPNMVLSGGLDGNLVDSIGACIFGVPILYVQKNQIPNVVEEYLDEKVTAESEIRIIGSERAVSEAVTEEAEDILQHIVSAVTLGGDAVVGKTLTATAAPAGATVTYEWLRSDSADGSFVAIEGATADTYELTATDAGKYIKVEVTGIGDYKGTVSSSAVGPVKQMISGLEVAARTWSANGDKIAVGEVAATADGFTVTVTGTATLETLTGNPGGNPLVAGWFGLQLSPEGVDDITVLEYKTTVQSTFAPLTEADVNESGVAGEIVWWINGDEAGSHDLWLKYADDDENTAIKLTVTFEPYVLQLSEYAFLIGETPGVVAGDLPSPDLFEEDENAIPTAETPLQVSLKATAIKDLGCEWARIMVEVGESPEGGELQAWVQAASDTDTNWYNVIKTGWGGTTEVSKSSLAKDEDTTLNIYLFADKAGEYRISFKAVEWSEDGQVEGEPIAAGEITITVLVNTDAYDAVVASVPEDNEDGTYTTPSWAAFVAAIVECDLGLTGADDEATLDDETAKIEAALALLEIVADVDTEAYAAVVVLVPNDNEDGKYTEESWTAFEEAINGCDLTLTAMDGQAALDAEVTKIEGALDRLIEQALVDAVVAANTELGKVEAALTAYITAGGDEGDTVYTDVEDAEIALEAALTGEPQVTAAIVVATDDLTAALGSLIEATEALEAALTAAVSDANSELAKVSGALTAYIDAGGDEGDTVYTAVEDAETALEAALAGEPQVTAAIIAATGELNASLDALAEAAEALAGTEGNLLQAAAGTDFTGVLYSKEDGKIYYKQIDQDGKWSAETAIATATDGRLAIDSDDHPHVVYTISGAIGYRMFDGDKWSEEELIESNNDKDYTGACSKPDIALDGGGYAHITYSDTHGQSGNYTDSVDIMYATNTSGEFEKTVIYNGYYENWGQGITWAYYYRNGSFITVDDAGNFYILVHEQDSSPNDFDFRVKIKYNTTAEVKEVELGHKWGSTTGANDFDIFDIVTRDGNIYALYRNVNVQSAELAVDGGVLTKIRDVEAAEITAAHSHDAKDGDIVAASLASGNKLQTHYNGTVETYGDITVKTNTTVSVIYEDGAFYAVYTGDDGKVQRKEIEAPDS